MERKEIDTNNPEFQTALRLIQYTHNSVFLTGKAGTGKSTFLKYVCANTKKKHVVLAPTGIAAINAGGCTLHSFFKLPFYPLLPDDPRYSPKKIRETLKYNQATRKLLDEVELIIIDEISMVRADIIDFIDKVLRIYTRNMREPFGGKQLLLVGDVFQLEPVVKSDERELLNRFYPNPFFFSARVFNEMELVSIELTKVYRQRDDVFVGVLDHIRNNTATAADLQLLNTRVNADFDKSNQEKMFITLGTRRDNVDFINDQKLAELPDDPIVFEGEIKGEFPETSLPTLKSLELKVGAQVIFIKNDMDRQWVNGTIGTIESIDIDNELLYIITEDGKLCEVRKDSWHNVRYSYNETEKRIEEEELGVFIQFPVRLAWAITIHKSQGLTFSRVAIDFTGGVFAGGQAYVALSRCTSLKGICLKKEILRNDIFVRPDIVNFAKRFNDQQSVERAMKQAQADLLYVNTVKLFNEGKFREMTDEFFKAIHTRYDIEKPLIKRFISKKLSTINKLKNEMEDMKRQMEERQEMLNGLAKEYYVMGNMCITEARDAKSAIKNYDKAIKLNHNYADAYIRKGVTLADLKKHFDACECFTKALDVSPFNFKALYNRGKSHLAMDHPEEACADLDRATRLNSENASAHEKFGKALMKCGKEREAALQFAIAEGLRELKKGKKSED